MPAPPRYPHLACGHAVGALLRGRLSAGIPGYVRTCEGSRTGTRTQSTPVTIHLQGATPLIGVPPVGSIAIHHPLRACDRRPEESLRVGGFRRIPTVQEDAMKRKKPKVRVECYYPAGQHDPLVGRVSIAALKALPEVLRLFERHGWWL